MAGPSCLRRLPTGKLRSRRLAVFILILIWFTTLYFQWSSWLIGFTATPKGLDFVRHFWSTDAFGFNITSRMDVPTPEQKASSAHTYRNDGLLEVNPEGPHPIFELVDRAEKRWKAKNAKASKTLKEAYDEYLRRNGRKPPLGFNDWWIYVKTYNVPLPDEYDLISRDLAPFWGINPRRLQQNSRNWESKKDIYTIGKTAIGGPLEMITYNFDDSHLQALARGYRELKKLLRETLDFIPPFRAVVWPHDNPNLLNHYELLQSAIEAGKENKYIDPDKMPPPLQVGHLAACRPNAPARNHTYPYTSLPPLTTLASLKFASNTTSSRKTFIHDHKTSMDPCIHPSLLYTHGELLANHRVTKPNKDLIPQFSYGPTKLHHDITLAVSYNWVEDVLPRSYDPPFMQKSDSRLQWRGRTTGLWFGRGNRWDLSQRVRLVDWANPARGQPTTAESVLSSPPNEEWAVGQPTKLNSSTEAVVGKMADAAFTSTPLDCDPAVCGLLTDEHEFRMWQNDKTQGRYRYIIDVDGNGWSSRFKRLITSNSLIFKSTIYEEWFYDRIEPWLHYIPVQVDYSDLLDILYFFRGDPSGLNAHPYLAEKIALAGREWSLTHWRREDLTAYMFRLLLEYARIMDTNRENGGLDYTYRPEDEFNPKDAAIPGSRVGSKNKFSQVMDRRRQRNAGTLVD